METLQEKIAQILENYIKKLPKTLHGLSDENSLFKVNEEKSTVNLIVLDVLDPERYAALIHPFEETDENNEPIK